jgi:hypothetical protein
MSTSSPTPSVSPSCARCMADDRSGHDQRRGRSEATRRRPSSRTTIATDIPGLRLVALTSEDADTFYASLPIARWTTRPCHHSGSSGQTASSRAASISRLRP